jgi:hypothetical protein
MAILLNITIKAQVPINVGIWEKFDKYSLSQKSIYFNKGEIKNQKDDDHDGYIDNINGIGFDEFEKKVPEYFYCNYDNKLDYDHGTAVASVLLNINPNIQLHGVSFVPTTQRLLKSELLSKTVQERIAGLEDEYGQMRYFIDESLKYFAKMNCKIVNISWGLCLRNFITNNPNIGNNNTEKEKVARAWLGEMKKCLTEGFNRYPNIIFVIAVGNEGLDIDEAVDIPATIRLNNVIAVGALDSLNKNIADFSNYGKDVIYAPGTEITCTTALKTPRVESGTSLATPFVSATLAHYFENKFFSKEDAIEKMIADGNIMKR